MINWIRQLLQRTPQETVIPPQVNDAPDVGAIHDGVDYSLPVMLPAHLEQQLKTDGQLEAYLKESARGTFNFQFDTPQRSGQDMPIAPVTDDPLMEWSPDTRRRVLTNAHAAFQRNPIAKAAVLYSADFIIGNDGFMVTAQNTEVRRVIDEFMDSPDNMIRVYERMAIADLQVDGELLLRLFTDDETGEIAILPMKPWELEEITLEDGFLNRKDKYIFRDAMGKENKVPADEMLMVAINRHAYEQRGRSELFAILPWLRAYKEWLENRARQNHWRGALLWWVQVAAKLPGTVAAVLARWRKPPTPGSVVVTSDQEQVSAITNSVGAGEAAEDGRQIKLMALAGIRLPEYFAGDGENANLATATAQQLPVLTKFAAFQQTMENQLWRPLLKRVVQAAMDARVLPSEVTIEDSDGEAILDADNQEQTIDTMDSFDVNYAPVIDANMLQVAQALAIPFDRGALDEETLATEMGLDWETIQKRLLLQQARQANEVRQGLRQPVPGEDDPQGMDAEEPEQDAVAKNGNAAA